MAALHGDFVCLAERMFRDLAQCFILHGECVGAVVHRHSVGDSSAALVPHCAGQQPQVVG
eukprot:6455191-Amphidinium_carterae.2